MERLGSEDVRAVGQLNFQAGIGGEGGGGGDGKEQRIEASCLQPRKGNVTRVNIAGFGGYLRDGIGSGRAERGRRRDAGQQDGTTQFHLDDAASSIASIRNLG